MLTLYCLFDMLPTQAYFVTLLPLSNISFHVVAGAIEACVRALLCLATIYSTLNEIITLEGQVKVMTHNRYIY